MISKIPFLNLARFPEPVKEDLRSKFDQILDKGIFSGSDEVLLLEKQLGEYLDSPHVVSCANGTDALEMALRALEIGIGDDVIVPAMSWVSTAEVVLLVGAKPIFIDTDDNGLLDLNLLDQVVTSKTKAIIPVHLYGKMVDMETLMAWARKRNCKVIEDAAQAFGAFQNKISAGMYGDMGCFSFYPSKNLGALGEAGALVCKDKSIAEKLKMLRNHGQIQRDKHIIIGRNSRIDTLQAGFLNVLLPYFGAWQDRRKFIAQIYLDQLKALDWLKLPLGLESPSHNVHLFVISTTFRDQLKQFLKENEIETAIHYPLPIPLMSPYKDPKEFPKSLKMSKEILSLPLNPWLSDEEVYRICDVLRRFKF
ncbi:DegT/DnrJ/EryC1/StrS family aminotransferase [Belliella sp. DSM 111904]|uniref:DegT/DnrJ/EryC1/StrS family aminotransferase n=1 Tax=Belliella filtrata TaxID=2923435 RepID=A0ABS9UWH0_9BACT|nr:DegT/DnrJ/EryC1/StrS family aminotransferase [Belliella filtrata]MCH7408497.1 DegT/DnrJ/EryC1/StrS family aminotransferase [Belliella filtrata]